MKKILVILVALAGISIAAYAQQNTDVAVSDLKIIKNGEERRNSLLATIEN